MNSVEQLPDSVQRCLAGFVARRKRLIGLRAGGSSLALLAVWVLLCCTADRLFHLNSMTRLGLLLAGGLSATAIGLWRLRPLRKPIDWIDISQNLESHDRRFNQALMTVTSRLLGSPDHRGSDEILSHLLRQVELRAESGRRIGWISLSSAAGPWALFMIVLAIIIGLAQMPALRGPRLLARLFAPLMPIAPVTTTELSIVSPTGANTDIMQSDALHVEVAAQRVGASPVWIQISEEPGNWTRYAMDESTGGRFTYNVNAVTRDLQYRISAGDAEIGPFQVRVRRVPGVTLFRIHYTYPPYTGKPPATVTNSDGAIEAPAGSEAVLTIVSTEPLQSALLTLGDHKILMDRADRDNERQATLRITNEMPYEVDLISTRELRGGGPPRMMIHAVVDHPPLVRLLQGGQTLRLNPRDILPLTYQSADDYGLESLTLLAQVNADPPLRLPIQIGNDRRRQEDTVPFDLGRMRFEIGDLLTLSLVARDTAGQETTSDEARVLISPRSVDHDARQRIADLASATRLASTLATELEGAVKATDEARGQKDHQSPAYVTASAGASRHLSSASEVGTLLRQSLLRTIAHSDSPELSTALAFWTDVVEQQSLLAEDLFRRGGSSEGVSNASADRLHRALDQARELGTQLRTVAVGERAAAALADREDLKAAGSRKPPADAEAAERLARALKQCNDELNAATNELGVNPQAGDAADQLRNRMEMAKSLVRSKQPLDFANATRQWAAEISQEPQTPDALDARLALAAQAEAVRHDAHLVRARDLALAARTAGALLAPLASLPSSAATPAQRGPVVDRINELANVIAALQHDHELTRAGNPPHSADEIRIADEAAEKARQQMNKWLDGGGATRAVSGQAPLAARQTELESLALAASATDANRDYQRAAQLDAALTQKLKDSLRKPARGADSEPAPLVGAAVVEERLEKIDRVSQAVAGQMNAAEKVDHLGAAEDKLLAEAKQVKSASRDLVGRQRNVAEQIATIETQQARSTLGGSGAADMDNPNWRGRATAALLFAQEELAAMPQELSAAQEASAVAQKAADRAEAAKREEAGASPDRKAILARATAQAASDAQDAAARLNKAIAPVAPQAADDLADRLSPFAPEASSAQALVSTQLGDALKALRVAASKNDVDGVARAAADARKAIDAAQRELARAQDSFTERDPLVAAKWFARAAVDSMSQKPSDLRLAMAHQANVSLALSRAWDKSVHRAAELRLSVLPSLQSVYAVTPPAVGDTPVSALSPTLAARNWGQLRARDGDDLSATMRDPDPPGYEEPLRLYFEALGKAQDKPK